MEHAFTLAVNCDNMFVLVIKIFSYSTDIKYFKEELSDGAIEGS